MESICVPEAGVVEEVVDFGHCKGIFARPADGNLKGAIVFSHGWGGYRCGPANLLTLLARCFAEQGFASLRFDYSGRGESGGNGLETSLATMAEDLVQASEFLREKTGCDSLDYCGLCSGGNVVIGALPRLPQARRLIMLSVYPFSDGDRFSRSSRRFAGLVGSYLHKACSWENWRRLFAGDASLKRVFGVLFRPFRKGESKQREGTIRKASQNESRLDTAKEPPKQFLEPLKKGVSGVFVYGTADPDAEAAMRYYGEFITEHHLPFRIERIEGATHNFTATAHRKTLMEILVAGV